MSTILSCETGFTAIGLQEGEGKITPIRVISTLVSVSVVSAWCSWTKVKRLSLFFAHWLRYGRCGLILFLFLFVEKWEVKHRGTHLQHESVPGGVPDRLL
ncbi:unnamed protein product [Ectocarpus sp. 12 AP-2014]